MNAEVWKANTGAPAARAPVFQRGQQRLRDAVAPERGMHREAAAAGPARWPAESLHGGVRVEGRVSGDRLVDDRDQELPVAGVPIQVEEVGEVAAATPRAGCRACTARTRSAGCRGSRGGRRVRRAGPGWPAACMSRSSWSWASGPMRTGCMHATPPGAVHGGVPAHRVSRRSVGGAPARRGRPAASRRECKTQLLQDSGDVVVDGPGREDEPVRDLGVRQPVRDESQDLDLSGGQPGRVGQGGPLRCPRPLPDALQSRSRSRTIATAGSAPSWVSTASASRVGSGWPDSASSSARS